MSQVSADLRRYLSVIARHWTLIVPAVVLVPLVALLLSGRSQKVYSASAQVLLTYSSPGATLNGLATPYPGTAPDRNVATQAALARDPAVAQQAVDLSGGRETASELLNKSSVSSPNDSDLLDFSVQDSSPSGAQKLATSYAQAYSAYRTRLDTRAITIALAGISRRIGTLVRTGQTGTPNYRTLTHDQQALMATAASGTTDAVLAQPAQSAVEVGPHPARSAAVGIGVGIILAIVLVFLMETFDQRVAADEVECRLKIPRLAAIPAGRGWRRDVAALIKLDETSGRRRAGAPLATLEDPNGREAKAFRVLKSRLELAQFEHAFKLLLFTSARSYGRQAETTANLAITFAQAGQRVLLCDLSTRASAVGDLFGIEHGSPGVTEVVLGRIPFEKAVVAIADPLLQAGPAEHGVEAGNGNGSSLQGTSDRQLGGSLDVLPLGGPAPHSGFLGTRAVAELLEQLKRTPYDLVLVDAPPLLASGEAQTLSTLADAVIIALPDSVQLRVIENLVVTLSRLPVLALGFVTVSVGASRAAARRRDPSGGRVGPYTPDRALARVTSIRYWHQQSSAPAARRIEGFRNVSRYADKLQDR